MSSQAPRVETRTELGTYQTTPTALDLVMVKHLFPLVRRDVTFTGVREILAVRVADREGFGSWQDMYGGVLPTITELLLILAELDGHATN